MESGEGESRRRQAAGDGDFDRDRSSSNDCGGQGGGDARARYTVVLLISFDYLLTDEQMQYSSHTGDFWQANNQQRANEDSMGRCASVHIEPLLLIVEQLREGKRIVLLIGYHCVRVVFYLVQLLVAATVDAAASLANAGTDTLGRVADSLLREIRALMQQIGKFVDQLRDSIMELAFSHGAGQTLKKVLQGLCKFVEVLHNVIWSSLVCPIIQFALMLAQVGSDFSNC
jgi:hypothetical protein